MKRIFTLFLLSIFILASALKAQEKFSVNGMVRPRMEFDGKQFIKDVKVNNFTDLRSQLGIKLMPYDNVTGFIQLQDSRRFGTEAGTLSDSKNVDLHQGYFRIDKFFELPLYLKAGRMELAYSNQRLIGSVGWHNVGRSFDGAILGLKTNKVDIDFFGMKTNESGIPGDTLDYSIYSAYGNLKFVKSYKIHPFAIMEFEAGTEFKRHTLGLYTAGKHGGFSHEVEAAYQLGTMVMGDKEGDIAAYMFAYNASYKFDSKVKPTLSAGIDMLSGNDKDNSDKYKSFNTLYATNHKFYGYMDYFLNIPIATRGHGLTDIHFKGSLAPFKKFSVALAFHIFNSAKDFDLPSGGTSNSFGSEIDLTLAYKYNKAVKFVGGFSMFTPGDVTKEIGIVKNDSYTYKGEDSSSWIYIMAVVNF